MKHITVFKEQQRYAGWPANYGMWNWDDEIVLSFVVGHHKTNGDFHARDTSKPFTTEQARSVDGGLTWAVSPFPGETPGGRALSADEHMNKGMGIGDVDLDSILDIPAEPINFEHPDFALICAKTGLGAGVRSFFYTSYDRCRSWQGPYKLPMFGQTGVAARTDLIVEGPRQALFFLTANKQDGHEGRVFCARTKDGGKTFEFVSFIHDEPEGNGFGIMPASLKLSDGRVLVAVRYRGGDRREGQDRSWIDLFSSNDGAESWAHVATPVSFEELGHNGNPATLSQLRDGRLCLIYGNRDAPYTICAKLSDDDGATWGDEITLRDGGGSYDIGYPRTVIRPDGKVVTGYYFNEQKGGDGPRFVEVTLWQPE